MLQNFIHSLGPKSKKAKHRNVRIVIQRNILLLHLFRNAEVCPTDSDNSQASGIDLIY